MPFSGFHEPKVALLFCFTNADELEVGVERGGSAHRKFLSSSAFGPVANRKISDTNTGHGTQESFGLIGYTEDSGTSFSLLDLILLSARPGNSRCWRKCLKS